MNFKVLLIGTSFIAVLALSACDSIVYSGDTKLTTQHAELYNDQFNAEVETGTLKEGQVSTMARNYWSNSNGPMNVNVTFDPHSKTNTARKASDEAIKLATALKKKGVRDVQYGTVAIPESGALSRTMISYDSLGARPPSDCPEAMGFEYADIDHDKDYKFGCSIETYTARQIARPGDLAGSGVMDNNSGRRDANILERAYVPGTPFEALAGENASQSGSN